MAQEKEDIALLRAKAEQGDADLQFALGKYYLSQNNEDHQEAYKWMRIAAEQGDERAIEVL